MGPIGGLERALRVVVSCCGMGRGCVLSARRVVLAVLLPVVLLLGAASAADAVSSFYWYGENDSACWQTGQLGSPSFGCDGGPGYLNAAGSNEGGRAHVYYDGVGPAVAIPTSGDYCDASDINGPSGLYITKPIAQNLASWTGLETVQPFESYQEGDEAGANCQSEYQYWGQTISTKKAEDCNPCGMFHFVSFFQQTENEGSNEKERPWANVFGNPSLVISSLVKPGSVEYAGRSPIVWGYTCPVLQDTVTGFMLEYCIQQWRGPFNVSQDQEGKHRWEEEYVVNCSSGVPGGPHGGALDMLKTMVDPGTKWVTEASGSANTFIFEHGQKPAYQHQEVRITASDLEAAIAADNTNCANSSRAGALNATNPADYALIGVEQGIEGWNHLYELGADEANLQLWTEYNPLPPTASTGEATNVQPLQATLNGSVNPNGLDTHYYFKYGKTTSYGSYVPAPPGNDAGSGLSSVGENATVTGLEPGTTYHYRIIATSAGGTEEGKDQEFKTPTPVVAFQANGGTLWTYALTGGYQNTTMGMMSGTSPSVAALPGGGYVIAFQASKGELWTYSSTGEYKNTTMGMMSGTSPSVAALSSSVYEVAFQANKGELWNYSSTGEYHNTTLGTKAGTNPSIT